MKYELQGCIFFEADDISDAFHKLATHFTALANGMETDLPLIGTNITIKEVNAEDPLATATKTTFLRGQRKT